MSPPSMTKSAPVTFPARSLASSSDQVGDLVGGGEPAGLRLRRRPARPTVGGGHRRWRGRRSRRRRRRRATGPWSTGPGLTVLTRMPCGPDLLRQGLGEVGQRGLGRAVVDDRRVGQEGVDRADRDDVPVPGREHGGQRGPGGAYRRQQVERQASQPVVVGDVEEPGQARRDGADVVDQDVEPAVSPARPRRARPGPSAVARSTWTPAHVPRRPARQLRCASCVRRRRP